MQTLEVSVKSLGRKINGDVIGTIDAGNLVVDRSVGRIDYSGGERDLQHSCSLRTLRLPKATYNIKRQFFRHAHLLGFLGLSILKASRADVTIPATMT